MAVYPPSGQVGPEGQARPEGCEDGAHGVDSVSEYQRKEPYPDDLVDQPRGPGEDEEHQHGPAEPAL